MQELMNIPADYVLTNYFKPYYEMFSDKKYHVNLTVDRRLGSILTLVNIKAGKRPIEVRHDAKLEQTLKSPKNADNRKIFVAFSGGKDCLATAIKAKQKGFIPTLVYIGGVNKSLPSERICAENVARASGFPLIELKLHIAGTKEYNEHPLKNILLLSMLVDEGLKHGCINFSFGNLFQEIASRGSLDYDFSDSWEMLRMFARLIAAYVKGMKLHFFLHDNIQSFYTVYRYDKKILPLLSTCIMPDFRRPMIQKANRAKFGSDYIPDNRCGNCYKCADDYIYSVMVGVKKPHEKFMKHCNTVIEKFAKLYPDNFKFDRKEFNRYGGKNKTDIQVLCDRCGYYIGKLLFDPSLNKFFVDEFYGSHHFETRAEAEAILNRYKSIYKL